MDSESKAPLCPPNAAAISYAFLGHLGSMLDESSRRGWKSGEMIARHSSGAG